MNKKILNIFAISLLVVAPAFAGWNPFATAEKAVVPVPAELKVVPPASLKEDAPHFFAPVARLGEWLPESTRGRVLLGAGIVAGSSAVYGGFKLCQKYAKFAFQRAFVYALEGQVTAYLKKVDDLYAACPDLIGQSAESKRAMMLQLASDMATLDWAKMNVPASLRENNGDVVSGLVHLIAGNTQNNLQRLQENYFLENERSEIRTKILERIAAVKEYIEDYRK